MGTILLLPSTDEFNPNVTVSWPGGSRLVKEGQTLTINEDGSSTVGYLGTNHYDLFSTD